MGLENMRGVNNSTEETRLLENESHHVNDVSQENGYSHQNDGQGTDDVPLTEQASTRELLAVLAATWVGVFFAALGMQTSLNTEPSMYLLRLARRHNHCHTYNSNIIRVQIIEPAFLVGLRILHCQCGVSARGRKVDGHLLPTQWFDFLECVLWSRLSYLRSC